LAVALPGRLEMAGDSTQTAFRSPARMERCESLITEPRRGKPRRAGLTRQAGGPKNVVAALVGGDLVAGDHAG
jgi:hypothetical protein